MLLYEHMHHSGVPKSQIIAAIEPLNFLSHCNVSIRTPNIRMAIVPILQYQLTATMEMTIDILGIYPADTMDQYTEHFHL